MALSIKFGPRLREKFVETINVIRLTFDSNPLPTNVSLTMNQICENKNETCPIINLQEGDKNITSVTITNVMSENIQKDKEDNLLNLPWCQVKINVLNPDKLENANISLSISNGIGLPLELTIKQKFQIDYEISK